MIIDGSIASDKTKLLVEKYVSLLNSGIDASKILVLVQNSGLKNQFIEQTLEFLNVNCFEKLQVYSFSSLVYNTVNENWAFIENKNPYPNPRILPNLTGLEVSQFILKDILKKVPFIGYNSKKSLLHQLFRRYSLIVQNNLSDEDVEFRTRILEESFGDDAQYALKTLLKETLALRDFDYLRQILIFNHIIKNTNYFKNIEYLILDDGDEITPVCFNFIEQIKPQLKDFYIAFDSIGASRIGYLSADKDSVWEFEKIFNEPVLKIDSKTDLKFDAENLYKNIKEDKKLTLEKFTLISPSKRSNMIELAAKKINELIKAKVPPSDIAVITPVIDEVLKFGLSENIDHTANLVYLSGSEKLIQNKLVLAAITILKLNTNLKEKITEFEIRHVLSETLGIPIKYCREILENFDQNKTLIDYKFEDEIFTKKYQKLREIVYEILPKQNNLSEQIYEIYSNLISPKIEDISKFNFFIKQIRDFEDVYGEEVSRRKEEIIIQTENSIIAENPYSVFEISEKDLIISTPQKLIDNHVKTRYQLWLDISNNDWIKSDTGPMYNAWVFQKGWIKDKYTIEDNIELSKEKTARILRKLALLAEKNIFTYSSLFDSNGIENFGGIEDYIIVPEWIDTPQQSNRQTFKIIPREDQQPVLDYDKGKMAISAVPGAGKTTILLALIIKLLDRGISPDNIFVMTYMESAARNFKERIKSIRDDSTQLPYISTIHGLALRILKENNNFERLGLTSDFEICDDTQKTKILKEAAQKFKISKDDFDDYIRAISIFKIGGGTFKNLPNSNQKLVKFKLCFEKYQLILKENNLIDYDDILLNAVKLLEENEDIRDYYQNICGYIIEDEAQDSSAIQQKLINILSGKYNNLIRCGDINQAITTTFSNADVKGFRQYIDSSNQVSMNCSQRCSKDVWELANTVVKTAQKNPATTEAFYNIMMKPVENKNPEEVNGVQTNTFDKPSDEQNFILKEIKNILKKNPKSTIGILLRYNSQVNQWANFITNSGLKSITRSESLAEKSIFKVIFAILKIIENPFDNEIIATSYETLAELGFYPTEFANNIRNSDKPYLEQPISAKSEQFYWDINYWLGLSYLTVDDLAIKIGLYYFSEDIEKSNVYLISTLIKRISYDTKELSTIINRLYELSLKNSLSGFKFFSEEDENNQEFFEGKIQLMTMHKSKGDEFDCVFIPELSEYSLPVNITKMKLRPADFIEQVKGLNPDYKKKTDFELKQEIIEENLRLLYVAITRAKRKLFLTCAKKYRYKTEPNEIFNIIEREKNANLLA